MRMFRQSPRKGNGLYFTSVLFISIFALPLAAPSTADAQEATSSTLLTVDDAMRRLMAHPSVKGQLEAREKVAAGIAASEGLWPNPQISYEREHVPAIGDSLEEYVLLTQRIEISGRLGLLSDAAELEAQAERLRIQADANSLRARLLEDFYKALYFQSRIEILDAWLTRLSSILKAVESREAAGDVSGYDLHRVAIERESLRRVYEETHEEFELARRWLVALLLGDQPGSFRVVGTLAPVDEPFIVKPEAGTLPQVRAYHYAAEAAEARAKANGRWWLPALTLQGGAKRVSHLGDKETGYVAGAAIEVPLFDRGQGAEARAEGASRLAKAQRIREERLAAAGLATLSQAFDQKLEILRQYAKSSASPKINLLQTVEAAYLEGEFGVVELLDGYRAHYQEGLGQLEFAWSARKTWLALSEIAGPPATNIKETP